MILLTDEEISKLAYRLSIEPNEQKKNIIKELYKQYKVFINNRAVHELILPILKKYIDQKPEFKNL
jgi:hypothetical protein